MKKSFTCFVLLVFALSFTNANAQIKWCDGDEPREFADYVESVGIDVISDLTQLQKETTYKMAVKWHIMNGSNANGIVRIATLDRILDVMCVMNSHYDTVGFRYILNDPVDVYINNAYSNLPSRQVGESMMSALNQANKINAYVSNLSALQLCGWATFPGTGAGFGNRQGGVFIGSNGDCFSPTNTTVTHELGHYFGLPHPFQTTSTAPTDLSSAERVTRNTNELSPRFSANCASTADRFCDTDADYIGSRWNCNSTTFTQLDVNGDLFNPNPSFYMSYSNDVCQSRFSPQQTASMIYFLLNTRAYLTTPQFPTNLQPVTGITTLQTPAFLQTAARNQVNFSWAAVPNATRYLLQVSTGISFSGNSIVLDTIVNSNSLIFNATNRFPTNQSQVYRWRVRAFNEEFTCGSFAVPSATQGAFYLGFGVNTPNLESSKFQVYPSLLQKGDYIRIDFSSPTQESAIVRFLDINGKLISNTQINEIGLINQQIQLPENLSNGIYLLQLQVGNTISNHKIIVQ